MDYSEQITEAQMTVLEKRIKAAYRRAAKTVKQRATEYFADVKQKAAELQMDIYNAKDATARRAAEKVYRDFMTRAKAQGKAFDDMTAKLAGDLSRVNQATAREIGSRMGGVFTENHNFAAYRMEHDLGMNLQFTQYDEHTVARLFREQPSLLPKPKIDIPKDLRWNQQKITSEITQGILLGDSVDQIAARLASVTDMNETSALRNARTAMTSAQNAGRIEAFRYAKSIGINVKKKWLATLDGKTRDAHRELDGQTAEVDEPFIVYGMKIMYPADRSAPASLVYNCRCTLEADIADVDEVEETYRRDNISGEPIKNMTYRQWQAAKKRERKQKAPSKKPVLKPVETFPAAVVETVAEIPQTAPAAPEKALPQYTFTEATTIQDADNMLARFGIVGGYEEGKVNLAVANAVNKAYIDARNTFGDKIALRGIIKYPKKADFVAAYSRSFEQIYLKNVGSKDALKKMADMAADQFGSGFWSSDKAEHFIRHELGHAIHSGIGRDKIEASLDALRIEGMKDLRWGKIGTSFSSYRAHGLSFEDFENDMAEAGKVLSAYGFTSNAEMVAESVAEYFGGNPRPFALKVIEILKGAM